MASLKGSKTEDNLKAAFAGESQANRRYLYFAQKADVEGYNDVSAVFRSTAEGETGHAHGHLEYLEEIGDPATGLPIGETSDNLRAAIAGETHEYTDMYPGMARTAREEGFDEIADWFETLAKAEKSHAGRFQRRSTRSDPAALTPLEEGRGSHKLLRPFCKHTRDATMREGSLEAPTRHRIAWEDPDFADRDKTEAEMHRIFDICHTCRRCFNLCDCLPAPVRPDRQFGDRRARSVAPADYQKVADACTLCDMCFMTKCPYVPPHEFNVDFPHRDAALSGGRAARGTHSAAAARAGQDRPQRQARRQGRAARQLGQRPQQHADAAADGNRGRHRPRRRVAQISRAAPSRCARSARRRRVDRTAPAFGRKAVLYATCFVNYNNPSIGEAARAVLAQNGVETEVVYPRCCGMPQLEQGDLAAVAAAAKQVAASLGPWIDKGYDIIALVPVLRADAQIRVAADRAARRGGREAGEGDLRRQRIRRRHRPQGGSCCRAYRRSKAA